MNNKKEKYGLIIAKKMIDAIKKLNLNNASVDEILIIINQGMRELHSSNMTFLSNTVRFKKHAIGSTAAYDIEDVNFCIKEVEGQNVIIYKSKNCDISIPYKDFLDKLAIYNSFETHSQENYKYLSQHLNRINIETIFPNCEPCKYNFYRARILKNKPTLINELSYPPSNIAKYGRANRENASIFYCSAHPLGAITEVRPQLGDNLVISKWRIKNNLNINLQTFEEETLINNNPVHKLIISFFCKEFKTTAKHESHYKITTALAEFLLLFEECNGISYSPATDLQNYSGMCRNFALKPQFVDNHMEFNSANFVQFHGIKNITDGLLLLMDYAIPDGNNIQWTGGRTPISITFKKLEHQN